MVWERSNEFRKVISIVGSFVNLRGGHVYLVRSMSHSNGGHDGAMHVCMTGQPAPRKDAPYYGSVLAKLRPATHNVRSYVWVQNLAGDVQPRYLTGDFLGAA